MGRKLVTVCIFWDSCFERLRKGSEYWNLHHNFQQGERGCIPQPFYLVQTDY